MFDVRHLPGEHDQLSHGHGGDGASGGSSSAGGSKWARLRVKDVKDSKIIKNIHKEEWKRERQI